jgi:hypothetical protein
VSSPNFVFHSILTRTVYGHERRSKARVINDDYHNSTKLEVQLDIYLSFAIV